MPVPGCPFNLLRAAVGAVPAGAWAVGVSGGADSVALLRLLHERAVETPGAVRLHVVHLDHDTRAGASAEDAAFVRDLCARLALPCTLRRRADLEPALAATALPANLSARFRALRLHLFREVCAAERLDGVLLAHHAGDQAETVLQRLARGSGPGGLCGMHGDAVVSGVRVLRPLLGFAPGALRAYLASIAQPWREDASNASPAYQRNRARAVLTQFPGVAKYLLDLAGAMADLTRWARAAAPRLAESFAVAALAPLPDVLAGEAARRWLAARGAPPDDLSPPVLARLVHMARDAATPPRQHFPGALLVRRRKGIISAG